MKNAAAILKKNTMLIVLVLVYIFFTIANILEIKGLRYLSPLNTIFFFLL